MLLDKDGYQTRLRMVDITHPHTNLSFDSVCGWCNFLCPHIPVEEAARALLAGTPIACPSVHVAGVYHVLEIAAPNMPGVIHAPRLQLGKPRHIAELSPQCTLFAEQAVAYASSRWAHALLQEQDWRCCLTVFVRKTHLQLPTCVAALILRQEFEPEDGLPHLDSSVLNLVPAGVSLHIPELEAAAAALPHKQWLCTLLCDVCGWPHLSACTATNPSRNPPACMCNISLYS